VQVLLLVVVWLVVSVTDTYPDPATRWTAIAAVPAGAALLAALIGLLTALAQLFLVERDLASLTTPGAAHDLRFHIAMGSQLRARLQGGLTGATPGLPAKVDRWTQQGYDRLQAWPALAQPFLESHEGYTRSLDRQLTEAPARIACLEEVVRELETTNPKTSA